MNKAALLPWNPNFFSDSTLYEPLFYWAENFTQYENWPELGAYQQLLDTLPEPIRTLHGKTLSIVAQDGKPGCFEEHYAPRIYLTGEIQTRKENWHDFFQFLTWFIFPKAKAVINSIHIPRARTRIEQGEELGRRSPMENMLSLFDEGGAVLVSSDETLLQLVRDFEWQALFWERRSELVSSFHCVTFGHAMYEKALLPYIGMTANCILLKAEPSYFDSPLSDRLAWIDSQLANKFEQGTELTKPKDLSPFPILGMPGWDEDNDKASYYANTSYFRPGRTGSKASKVVEA